MNDFERNFSFQQRYDQDIRRLVGEHLTEPAELRVDREEATDYVLVYAARNRDFRFASRLRRPGFLEYAHQLTIRAEIDSGGSTEWDKFKAGWCDWMFYGHEAKTRDGICLHWIIDLHVLRSLHADFGDRILTNNGKPNGKGQCFHTIEPFALARPPFSSPELVVATSHQGWANRDAQAVLAF